MATLAYGYYNRACVYSLHGLTTKSLADLKRAIKISDQVDFDLIFEDRDLENVRDTDAFKKWVTDDMPPRFLEKIMSAR
jgi:hypothetical protein